MHNAVIIVAGGLGSRMNPDTPKQFMPVLGKPILFYSLEIFREYNKNLRIIVVLPKEHVQTWESLCLKHNFTIDHQVTTGGRSRFDSVQNGLQKINTEQFIAIHDGARPLANLKTITTAFELAKDKGNAVPVVSINESVRKIENNSSSVVNRDALRIVQTPQVFEKNQLVQAYRQTFQESFTDDASVVEAAGFRIFLSEGNIENIKITKPSDIIFAEAILKKQRF